MRCGETRRCMMCGAVITEYTGRFEDTQTGVTTCIECVGKYMDLYYGTRQRKVTEEEKKRTWKEKIIDIVIKIIEDPILKLLLIIVMSLLFWSPVVIIASKLIDYCDSIEYCEVVK